MAKTKTPVFSLGAHGSIGDVLTLQRRGQDTIVRAKPTPTDPFSLPQAYQRWLYQDYAQYWTEQSAATQQAWVVAARPFRISGFQYWMRYHLTNLPDIVAWYKLDNIIGGQTQDKSANSNTGTVFGASLVDGRIDHALIFDAINDHVTIPHIAPLQLTQPFAFEVFVYPTAAQAGVTRLVADKFVWGLFYDHGNAQFRGAIAFLDDTATWQNSWGPVAIPKDTWSHIYGEYSNNKLSFILNGLLGSSRLIGPFTLMANALDAQIGANQALSRWFPGIIDNLIIYNRAPSLTQIQRHAARRYPV